MEREEAQAALEAVRNTDRQMAEKMSWPLWRHAAAGALQALFVITWATPMPFGALTMGLALAGIWLIGASDRKRHGMFVNGWSSKAARPAVLLAVAITLAGFVAIFFLGDGINRWTPFAPPVAGAVFVGVTLSSLWWQKLYQGELEAGR